MHICTLRTNKVGLPTRPDNRLPFDPIPTGKMRTDHQDKKSVACVSVHRRIKKAIGLVLQAQSGMANASHLPVWSC